MSVMDVSQDIPSNINQVSVQVIHPRSRFIMAHWVRRTVHVRLACVDLNILTSQDMGSVVRL